MKVRFDGPREQIRTTLGVHRKGEVKEYPEAVGRELIETGIRNKFSEVKAEAKAEVSQVKETKEAKEAKEGNEPSDVSTVSTVSSDAKPKRK